MALNLELLVDSPAFWARLAPEIRAARHRVFAQTLSFEADSAGLGLSEALLACPAADRRLIVDEFTKHVVNDKFIRKPKHWLDRELWQEVHATRGMMRDLAAGGVGVRFTNPAGPLYLQMPIRNHKKLIAIDGGIVYIGGINFSEHNFAWHDLMIRIEDESLADFLEADFEDTWRGVHRTTMQRFEGFDLHILGGRENERDFEVVLDLIEGARSSIFVESAYIGPPFSEALREASLRGVRVTVFTAELNNWALCRDHIRWKAAGAPLELRFYPDRMVHTKAMLIDDDTLILGSANFEIWSYRFQQEYVCIIRDPGALAQFRERIVVPDVALSRRDDTQIGAWRGRLADLQFEWIERITLAVNGRTRDVLPRRSHSIEARAAARRQA